MLRFLALLTLLALSGTAAAGSPPNLAFQRYWPVLNQPWYYQPGGIAVDGDNFIYVADSFQKQVQKYSRDGRLVQKWGSSAPGPGQLGSAFNLVLPIDNRVYVPDTDNVVVFDRFGGFIREFDDEGQNFRQAIALDVDPAGNVYVLDKQDWLVKKFAPGGAKITEWGGQGTAAGQFGVSGGVPNGPTDLDIHIAAAELFVADTYNNRIQVFDLDGNFVREFDGSGQGTAINEPRIVYVEESSGLLYTNSGLTPKVFTAAGVFQNDLALSRFAQINDITTFADGTVAISTFNPTGIELIDPEGNFAGLFSSAGSGDGFLNAQAYGLEVGPDGNLYAGDKFNQRVQVFDANGTYVRQFPAPVNSPEAMTVDGTGNVIYSRDVNAPLEKVDAMGNSIRQFGNAATYKDLDAAPDDTVYAADFFGRVIEKYDAAGNLVTSWGSEGLGDGQFSAIQSIALSNDGHLYVADTTFFTEPTPIFNSRIQKFTTDGVFVESFSWPVGSQEVGLIGGIAVGPGGFIYAAQIFRDNILILDPGDYAIVGQVGTSGYFPGQLGSPQKPALDAAGNLYVIEAKYNRIHAFSPPPPGPNRRAIIVTGGGPYPGNALWEATQASANYAYRIMAYQGFTKSSIQYLTPDSQLDLDQNGVFDDVDGDVTAINLEAAITGGFAQGVDQLILYMVDHGGDNQFRMSETETLSSTTIGGWLDQWQTANPGSDLVVVYDACQSGSFIDDFANPSFSRRIITSTEAGENAHFVSQGTISFSNFFWTEIQNGQDLANAFANASTAISDAFPSQVPQVDGNGNGVAQEFADLLGLVGERIGNGTTVISEVPFIDNVSPTQTITNSSTATVSAGTVADPNGIARVWAVVRPPGFQPSDPDNPIADLPTIEMRPGLSIGEYVGTSDIFSIAGTYQIAIYATDGLGNTAPPELTSVIVDSPLARRAIVIGGPGADAGRQSTFDTMVDFTNSALDQQGYGAAFQSCPIPDAVCDATCDNLCVLSASAGAAVDAAPTLQNVQHAIMNWAGQDTVDLTIYLVGEQQAGSIVLDSGQVLDPTALDGWLDATEASLTGRTVVIVDSNNAAGFLGPLGNAGPQNRILMGSTGPFEVAAYPGNGTLGFSQFFWSQVIDGNSVGRSFRNARSAVTFTNECQSPQLDDTNNGVFNEFADGIGANAWFVGSGILLAGDKPAIGTLSDPGVVTGPGPVTLTVSNIATTGTIADVSVVVADAMGCELTLPMTDQGDGSFSIDLPGLSASSPPTSVAVYATDADGSVSPPATTVIRGDRVFDSGFEG